MSSIGGGINVGAAFGVNIPIDYTSRDFSALLNDMQTLVPTFTPEWPATSELDFGVILLELWAYVGDIDNYYIDRVANESFLTTAQQRSSVINIAALIDYDPEDAASASAIMTLTLAPNSPTFVLPIYSMFATNSTTTAPGIIFETLQAYSIPAAGPSGASITADATGAPIRVYQGVVVQDEALGNSDGTPSQDYTLINTGVVGGSVAVSVDVGGGPVAWTEVGSLIDAGPYDAVYTVSTDANGVVYVDFGDGNSGAIPNPQAAIEATYIVGGGSAGNVAVGQITVDMTGSFLSVINGTAASGGSDPETVAQIQANAPASLTAANRCVSVQDYATVALQMPGVAQAYATAAIPTSITLYVHPSGGPYNTSDLTSLVTDPSTGLGVALTNTANSGYLDTRKMAGSSVSVIPPVYDGTVGYMPIVLAVTVTVQPQFSRLVTQQAVTNAVVNLFSFATMGFGQRLTLASVYSVINAVQGVAYLVVTSMMRGDASVGTLGDILCGPAEIPVLVNPNTSTSGLTLTMIGGL